MKEDLYFISQEFVDLNIPKSKRYLLKYFKTDTQKAFLKYYMVFKSWKNFVDHTGYYCGTRYLRQQEEKYHALIKAYQEASSVMDEEHMQKLQLISEGKYKWD